MSKRDKEEDYFVAAEETVANDEVVVEKSENSYPFLSRRWFIAKTALEATGLLADGFKYVLKLDSVKDALNNTANRIINGPPDIWAEMIKKGPASGNIVTLLFGSAPTEISLISGRSNPRMPTYNQDSSKRLPSQATRDISTLIVKSLFKNVGVVDHDLSYIDNPSISVGGPVVCKAWRHQLGWKLRKLSDGRYQFFRESDDPTTKNGVFHNIGFEPFQLGEVEKNVKRHWPLIGNAYNTQGKLLKFGDYKNHLIVTYLKDTGNQMPHLNFTGTNSDGTWGAIHLFRHEFSTQVEDLVGYAQDISRLGWQLVFCFQSSVDYVQTGISRRTAEQIVDVGIVPLG